MKKIIFSMLVVMCSTPLFAGAATACVTHADCNIVAGEICSAGQCVAGGTPIQGGSTTNAPAPAVGQGGTTSNAPVVLQNPIKYDTFSDFVAAVTRTAVNVLLPFVVLAFIYSGFLFVRAQGNEKELEEAKSAIKWSVIGAFILFGAWGFAQVIGQTVSTITN